MKNAYHRDIMTELISRGSEGMRIYQIARCIYNKHCGLFDRHIDYESIYRSISFYLWSQSKLNRSPFIHRGRGLYALKPDVAIQLDFFLDLPLDEKPQSYEAVSHAGKPHTPQPVQLYLFDMDIV